MHQSFRFFEVYIGNLLLPKWQSPGNRGFNCKIYILSLASSKNKLLGFLPLGFFGVNSKQVTYGTAISSCAGAADWRLSLKLLEASRRALASWSWNSIFEAEKMEKTSLIHIGDVVKMIQGFYGFVWKINQITRYFTVVHDFWHFCLKSRLLIRLWSNCNPALGLLRGCNLGFNWKRCQNPWDSREIQEIIWVGRSCIYMLLRWQVIAHAPGVLPFTWSLACQLDADMINASN